MLITKEVDVKWNSKNKKWYMEKGYSFTKMGDAFQVRCEDLNNSQAIVDTKCDNIDCGVITQNSWTDYLRQVKKDGKTYCKKCANKLYAGETRRKESLSNGLSLYQYCINNNVADILERWDYDLNNFSPQDISFSSVRKIWFKCPYGKHKSELKSIFNHSKIVCNACNSFGQYLIDNFGDNALNLYWSDLNECSPFNIPIKSNKKVWIKCQNKNYHKDYDVHCCDFVGKNTRCPYCQHKSGKTHINDSLGMINPKSVIIWSDINSCSPYEYSLHSQKEVWWKCPERKHKDYKRSISSSTNLDYRCPYCEFSKGEKRVENYLLNSYINFIPQKSFDDLLGIKNGILSYDFYLPDYNLLIEYQGEQHEHYCKGFHKSIQEFNRQHLNDLKKKEYVESHKISLLEIWYYDFDNVENILSNYFQKLKLDDLLIDYNGL